MSKVKPNNLIEIERQADLERRVKSGQSAASIQKSYFSPKGAPKHPFARRNKVLLAEIRALNARFEREFIKSIKSSHSIRKANKPKIIAAYKKLTGKKAKGAANNFASKFFNNESMPIFQPSYE